MFQLKCHQMIVLLEQNVSFFKFDLFLFDFFFFQILNRQICLSFSMMRNSVFAECVCVCVSK